MEGQYIQKPVECRVAGCHANCCYADYELNKHQFKDDPKKCKYYKQESDFAKCLLTSYDEYWGRWLECGCGYKNNTDGAKYCGGCGKLIKIIGKKEEVD